ncbi:DUF2339 domain-containing protein [Affinibrenneria salicis]|uniref:DUF2339 domain-containing protein n=1 Tax=Affinibrenneria salicis TaxID=2590031 RepID=A0A5J5G543_9GAMM|nr:DUF2339 domain-containing protein [Affinibrenneria salicis]KAA9001995.1 DUF2339 domain-containing protein [Affinibrenneria salicis]
MEDILYPIGILLLFLFLAGPLLSLVALIRSAHVRRETERLQQEVKQLRSALQQLTSGAAPAPAATQSTAPLADDDAETPWMWHGDEADTASQHDAAPAFAQAAESEAVSAEPAVDEAAEAVWRRASAAQPAAASPGSSAPTPIKEEQGGIFSSLVSWFLKGNPLAKLGIILLFFGLAYLMKYSIERNLLPIEVRMCIAAAIGCGLLALGWRLRRRQLLYALILQGGAIGALYITAFGAFRLYMLLPYGLTFALLLAICAASVLLAVLQRSLSLAMLASLGGYLAPLLLSQGGGDPVMLFSYYLLLSLGILAISARQSWRELNLLGLLFSFGVGALWGMSGWQPQFYFSCQLFLLANILIFGVATLIFSLRHQPVGKEIIDGVLLFAPPLLGFGMQYVMTRHWAFGPAFSSLGFGLLYLALGWAALRYYPQVGRRLAIYALALGGAFSTLAIPLALSASWTALAWLVEGLALLWAGVSQRQRRLGWSGSLVMLLGLFSALYSLHRAQIGQSLLIFAVLALCYLAASYVWRRYRPAHSEWRTISRTFFILGMLTWVSWLMYVIIWYLDLSAYPLLVVLPGLQVLARFLLLCALSALLWNAAGCYLRWRELRQTAWLLWPVMLLTLLALAARVFSTTFMLHQFAPLAQIAIAASFIISFAAGYLLLWRERDRLSLRFEQTLHLLLFWAVCAYLLLMMVHWLYPLAGWGQDEWRPAMTHILLAAMILALVAPARHRLWPLSRRADWYVLSGPIPLVALLFVLLWRGNLLDGQIADWFWLPLLNPLEISALAGLLALVWWARRYAAAGRFEPVQLIGCRAGLWLLALWWLNGSLLRALAWYAELPWSAPFLWNSRLVQTSLALVWTLGALLCMIWATRRARRTPWLVGALVLAVTVVKLFLVDSAGSGGLARAIAFIGVAVLVLIVGYFAPLPPRRAQAEASENRE